MTAVTSRRRVPTAALWGALGVLAWALLVALFGGGAAHASDRGAPHDPPSTTSAQNSHQGEKPSSGAHAASTPQRAAHQLTDRAQQHASRDPRRESAKQDSEHRTDQQPAAKPQVSAKAQAPVQKATEQVRHSAKAPGDRRSTVTAPAKQFAYAAEPASVDSAPLRGTAAARTSEGQRDGLRDTQYQFSSFASSVSADEDQERVDAASPALLSADAPAHAERADETFTARGAVETVTSWASTGTKSWSTGAKNAHRAAAQYTPRWDRDHSRAWNDDRHRGHDRSHAARHGQHRVAPAHVVRAAAPGTPATVASSWTRAVVGHHADVTAVAAPSTTPSDDGSVPSDDSSADMELPAPVTPAAPSTTSTSSVNGPIAVAAAITDDMQAHEGTPVRAAEATQSVVHAAPVLTTDVSPD